MRKEQKVKIPMNEETSYKENYRITQIYLEEGMKKGKHKLMKHKTNIQQKTIINPKMYLKKEKAQNKITNKMRPYYRCNKD